MTAEPRLTLYTRPGCHLCEVAAEQLRALGEPFAEVDITSAPDLEMDYGHRIPVLVLDGKEYAEGRVEIERLRHDLAG